MKFLDLDLPEELYDIVADLVSKLKNRKFEDSISEANATIELSKRIILNCEWKTAEDLMKILKTLGNYFYEVQPSHNVLFNIIRRVLKLIRDEYASHVMGDHKESEQESLYRLALSHGPANDYSRFTESFQMGLLECIDELSSELETSVGNISQQSLQHIHNKEYIMTMGRSSLVEAFIKRAAKKRNFTVIVAESAPFHAGHDLAASLIKDKIKTILISDSNVFSMMSRVNKVILGTHTVLANGGLKALSGSHNMALAAKHFSVPVIVCATILKLSPIFQTLPDQYGFNEFVSPELVLPFEGELAAVVDVCTPVYDYVPPELVELFIFNIGGNSPSYVYRLLSELYHPEDYKFGS